MFSASLIYLFIFFTHCNVHDMLYARSDRLLRGQNFLVMNRHYEMSFLKLKWLNLP